MRSPEDEALLSKCLTKIGCEELSQCLLVPYSEFLRLTGLNEDQGSHAWSLISQHAYPWQQNRRLATDLQADDAWIFTGDRQIDRCLGGGVRLGSIVEVVGESAAGKTQLCLQLSIAAQLPESVGGLNGDVIYISTEGAFPVSRLDSMIHAFTRRVCGSRRVGVDEFMRRIQVAEFEDMETMFHALDYKVPGLLERGGVRLVVVDSIAAHLRYNTADEAQGDMNSFYRERSDHLVAMGAKFKKWAQQYRCAFICTNQVKDVFEANNGAQNHRTLLQRSQLNLREGSGNSSGGDSAEGLSSLDTDDEFASMATSKKAPALGATWANIIDTRIMLYQRRGFGLSELRRTADGQGDAAAQPDAELPKSLLRTRRWMENAFSPWAPRSQCEVVLDDSGFHHSE